MKYPGPFGHLTGEACLLSYWEWSLASWTTKSGARVLPLPLPDPATRPSGVSIHLGILMGKLKK